MKSSRVVVVALALLLAATPVSYGRQSAEELYQAGLHQEEVQGDPESAIEVYERILEEFPDNRAVNAKAQLHIGLCYEKLGLTEAQRAYQRVIDGYPERQDEVAVARERLAKLTQALAELSSKPSFRKIEIASNPQNGVLSPDGTKLAFISEGGVWVVPLEGNVDRDIAGEPVRIAEVPGVWDSGNLMAWSAGGDWIAVAGESDAGTDAVYVIPAGGGVPRVVRVPDRGGHAWSYRVSLSPDGQKLAFSALELSTLEEVRETHARYVYSMPTVGGEPTQVSSDWARLPSYSPDGELIAYVGYRERDAAQAGHSLYHGDLWVASSTGANPVRLATADGRLRGPVWSPDGNYIAAHHEPLGNNASNEIWVFPLSPDASSAGGPTKIALPRSSLRILAGWTPDGELGLFMEAESHTAIYTVPASGGKAVQVIPDARAGIWYPRWSPDGERIYFRPLAGDNMVKYVPAAGGEPVGVPTARTLVVVQPNGGFHISSDGRRVVFSAAQFDPSDPERSVDIWTAPLDGGSPTRLTNDGSRERYPCWSPDRKWVAFTDLYEKSEGESFHAIYVVPTEGGEIRQISSESDRVGPGAIAFSPDGERIAFFSGSAIKTIRLDGGRSEVLVTEVQSTLQSDLAWSPDGAEIAYSGAGRIWVASLGGGAPEELRTGLPEGIRHGQFSWSPDGEKIAFVGSLGIDEYGIRSEFWLISDFLPREMIVLNRSSTETPRRLQSSPSRPRYGPFRIHFPTGTLQEEELMKFSRVIVVALALLLAGTPVSYGRQSAEELYQAGLHQEEVQGNPERAIEVYERILEEFPDNRAVNARAQLHIGLCYEKLGLTEAQRAYQRVIDEYAERRDEVAVARERLASLSRALAELNRQPTFRKIEIASSPQNGTLSPDGNMLAFASDGAVWAVPLQGNVDPNIAGEPVRLADVPGVKESLPSMLAWSADGKWIAVNYQAQDKNLHVYLIPAAGGEPRVVQMPKRGGGWWNYRLSLSPDGQQLAISALDPARQEDDWGLLRVLYSIPTAGGELRRLASGYGEQGAFSPDGELIAFVSPRRKRDWPENIERKQPDLGLHDSDLWVVPTAGGTAVNLATVQGRLRGPVWSPDGRFVAIHHQPGRTMDSKEIRVYPLSPDASSAGEPIKISLPLSSFSLLAGWTPDDELGVFLETDIRVALYTVPSSGGPAAQLTSDGAPYYPRWSPDGERIYFRGERPRDDPAPTPAPKEPSGLAYVSAAGGEVVEVPWPGPSLQTGVPGAGHNVSPDGERIVVSAWHKAGESKGISDIWTIPLNEGLPIQLTDDESPERYPCWSPDGRWVAFTDTHERSEDDVFRAIHLVSAEGGQISQISSESDDVGAGAIAFSPDGARIAFFSEGAIKTIPVQGGQLEVLVAEVLSGRQSQLEFSPDGSRIAHNAGGKIWITPLGGGAPEELRTGLPDGADIREVSWSPDGERIVFMALIGGDSEFWLISDFLREER